MGREGQQGRREMGREAVGVEVGWALMGGMGGKPLVGTVARVGWRAAKRADVGMIPWAAGWAEA